MTGEHDSGEQESSLRQPSRGSGKGVNQLSSGQFDLAEAIGGVRGLIESIAPGLVFVVMFIATRELSWALIGAVALAVIGALGRLISRGSLNYVVNGLLGVGIGAIWAWRTGQAEDFFVWGLYVNAAGVLAAGLSIVFRRPLVGLVVGALVPLGRWHAERQLRRVFIGATLLWLGMFALRLAVQVPLYLQASVGWLGTARLAMGIPLWALVLFLTWVMVRPVVQRAREQAKAQEQAADQADPAQQPAGE